MRPILIWKLHQKLFVFIHFTPILVLTSALPNFFVISQYGDTSLDRELRIGRIDLLQKCRTKSYTFWWYNDNFCLSFTEIWVLQVGPFLCFSVHLTSKSPKYVTLSLWLKITVSSPFFQCFLNIFVGYLWKTHKGNRKYIPLGCYFTNFDYFYITSNFSAQHSKSGKLRKIYTRKTNSFQPLAEIFLRVEGKN